VLVGELDEDVGLVLGHVGFAVGLVDDLVAVAVGDGPHTVLVAVTVAVAVTVFVVVMVLG
jgi:hypothetical protein